jgi:hypothetical protein
MDKFPLLLPKRTLLSPPPPNGSNFYLSLNIFSLMVSKDEWEGILKRFKNRCVVAGKRTVVSFVEKLKNKLELSKKHI